MSVNQAIAPHLPSLRRFARALSGSQQSGDAYVVAVLEALLENPAMLPAGLAPKIGLYRLFLSIWNSVDANAFPTVKGKQPASLRKLQTLTPKPRQAFLLSSMEGFEPSDIAQILEADLAEAESLLAAADREIAERLEPADILIIEDEPYTAHHLKDLVQSLGHRVVGLARTRKQAIALAERHRPRLILSDIALADGSSGVDAVNEILSSFEVPVIFVTGHAEALLTGGKPEPAFLISKPFRAETVKAVIGQALFFKVRSRTHGHAGEEGALPARA